MEIIKLNHISKEYRSDSVVTPALSGIDLSIEKGEFIAIMGASGSGKTTLLNIIGCMDVPTTGTYLFDGVDLSHEKEKMLSSIRGKRIAFVFQHFALIDDYTVFENIEIPLLKQPIPKSERKMKVTDALKTVGITDLSKKPTHISGGQKQRVAIARAIACGAEVILADEPTGALDSKTCTEIMKIFSELNASGKTVILITHDRQVASYANRLIKIHDGRIISDEKIKKVILSFAAICLMFSMVACTGNNVEYESIEEFERHFIQKEYGSEYITISEVFTLKEDTDYQFKLDAKCESGIMDIHILYDDAEEKVYSVNPETPCNELLMIPSDSVNEVEITVSIMSDTNGSVIGNILAKE